MDVARRNKDDPGQVAHHRHLLGREQAGNSGDHVRCPIDAHARRRRRSPGFPGRTAFSPPRRWHDGAKPRQASRSQAERGQTRSVNGRAQAVARAAVQKAGRCDGGLLVALARAAGDFSSPANGPSLQVGLLGGLDDGVGVAHIGRDREGAGVA